MIDFDDYANFSEDEFRCKCGCGGVDMTKSFMDKLQATRTALGFGLTISSGYRCVAHDKAERGKGEHTLGDAADIKIYGEQAFKLLSVAPLKGFNRIGLKQHGLFPFRFIHLGCTINKKYPSPWIWSYG